MKHLAIIGSRDYHLGTVKLTIQQLCGWLSQRQRAMPRGHMLPLCIVSGAGGNVDESAEAQAKWFRIPYLIFPADWGCYQDAAGPIRNQWIAQTTDFAIAITPNPQAPSKGTANCLRHLQALNKPVIVVDHTQLDQMKAFIETHI